MTGVAEGGEMVGGILVDRRFLRSCRRWPLVVATDLCRYFVTRADVSPGQVVK